MQLQLVDYILMALTVGLTVLGLSRGISGAFAFLAGVMLGAAFVFLCWDPVVKTVQPELLGYGVALLIFILVFGLVHLCVKVFFGALLSQPSDSIFGCCFGLFCGAMLLWGISLHPSLADQSALAGWFNLHIRVTGVCHVG